MNPPLNFYIILFEIISFDVGIRIYRFTVDTQFEMQVQSGRISGHTDSGDRFALFNDIADLYVDFAAVSIKSREAAAVIDNKVITVTVRQFLNFYDLSGLGGIYRRAVDAAGAYVDTGMSAVSAEMAVYNVTVSGPDQSEGVYT